MSNILRRLSNAAQDREQQQESNAMETNNERAVDEPVDKPRFNTTPSRTSSNDQSILTPDVKFEGDIEFTESLTIYGEVKGSITSKGTLFFEKGSNIDADINVDNLTIKGSFKGSINASNSVKLLSDSKIYGNIAAKSIGVEDGATFVGESKITR